MPRISRRLGTRLVAKPDDFPDPVSTEGSIQTEPLDPADIAVSILLTNALTSAQMTAAQIGSDGLIVVVSSPGKLWTDVALEVWRVVIRKGERYHEGFQRIWDHDRWVAWAPQDCERPHALDEASVNFAKAVAVGRHCVAITADLSWLPPDIVHGADHNLTLLPLSGADVAAVAAKLCNVAPTKTFSDERAVALTPRLLRLARRPGQDANAYICKLHHLLDRDLAAAAVVAPMLVKSPRETPNLDRLHGLDEAVTWGKRLKTALEAYTDGKLAWADVDSGCLLSGPPGCGKTIFARAVAESCRIPLVTGSYSDWYGSGSSHQGDLLKAMRQTFEKARASAPCILFIDEIDSFPNRSTITHAYADWEIQVVNALLALVDGVQGREGVVLLGACNHPQKLDPALVRSGRLGRHIRIQRPNRLALARILREHLSNDLLHQDLSGVALAFAGSTGADCEALVRGARGRAREGGRPMTIADLMAEIDGDDVRTEGEVWLAAVHEAGHAVASCVLYPGMLKAVALRASGDTGGGTLSPHSGAFRFASSIHRRLIFMLAGRAAEATFTDEPSSGAGGPADSDLAMATGLAATAAASLGLGDAVGLVWSGVPDTANLRQMLVDDPALAGRVRIALDLAYVDALELMRRWRDAVEAVAVALIARRALDGAETAVIVGQHPATDVEEAESWL